METSMVQRGMGKTMRTRSAQRNIGLQNTSIISDTQCVPGNSDRIGNVEATDSLGVALLKTSLANVRLRKRLKDSGKLPTWTPRLMKEAVKAIKVASKATDEVHS